MKQLRQLQMVWLVLVCTEIPIVIVFVVFVLPGWEARLPELGNYAIAAAFLLAVPALLYRKTFMQAKEEVEQQLRHSPEEPITAMGALSQKMFIGATRAESPATIGIAHALLTATVPFMIIAAVASMALKFLLFRPPRQPG